MEIYDFDKIDFISIDKTNENELTVVYSPILETLYFSPGAVLKELSDRVEISFIRCHIKKECLVSHKASPAENSRLTLKMVYTEKPVFMKYGKKSKQLFPH